MLKHSPVHRAVQVIFITIFYFIALPVFGGFLMIGYSTYYTMVPVFLLCMDKDLPKKHKFSA